MNFKGRTVIAFVLLALFAGSLLTMAASETPLWERTAQPAVSQTPVAAEGGLNGEALKKVEKAYDLIEHNFLTKVEKNDIVNGAINGMLKALDDPYTTYMDQEEAKLFDQSVHSSFQGIGAECSMVDGVVTVVAPIKGAPAEKAGIRAGDAILMVDGEKLDGFTLNQAVAKIRGEKGTQVKLSIGRAGAAAPLEIVVVRDDIPVETVYADMVNGQIGKIEIHQFATDTAERFTEELNNLERKGMKGLVIDVRDDPGGLLDSVLDIAKHFVEKNKVILQAEDREGRRSTQPSDGKYPVKTYPVTVLINGGSASASEILAGIIQEAAGGKVVGETSFGKGTVQVTYEKEMGDGSNIKMTIMKWLTPKGNWIHKKGIKPDIEVKQPEIYTITSLTKEATLKADGVGDEVKKLQIMLKAGGYAPDRTDGYYSVKTAEQVKAFQKANKLPQTGEADVKTQNALETVILKEIRDPKNDAQLKAAVDATEKALQAAR